MKFRPSGLAALAVLAAASPLAAQQQKSALQAAPSEVTFAIGESEYAMPLPDGYCVPTGENAVLSAEIAEGDSQNRTLVDLDVCGTFGENYILVKTPRAEMPVPFGRAMFFELMAREFQREGMVEQAFDEAGEDIAEMTDGTMTIAPVDYGYTGHDDDCLYTSGVMRLDMAEGSAKTRVAGCTTIIDNRVIAVHAYDLSDKQATIEELVERVRTIALSIARQ